MTFPIREFSKAVCGFGRSNPLLVMLVAYFDESGIHDHSTVVSVGGLVGQTREWGRLERPWKQNLAVTGVEWFHAYECEEGVEQFEGFQRGLRDSLVKGLSIAIADRHLGYIGASVYREDWNRYATPALKRNFLNSPFAFCVANAITRACYFAQTVGRKPQHVAVIFALPSNTNRGHIETIVEAIQRGDIKGLGSVTFSTPQQLIPLQAADLIAYESYQFLRAMREHGSGNFTTRPALEHLRQSGEPFFLGYFDAEGLRNIASDLPAFAPDPSYFSSAGAAGAISG